MMESDAKAVIARHATRKGIALDPDDIMRTDTGYHIDGMPWTEWLDAMTE